MEKKYWTDRNENPRQYGGKLTLSESTNNQVVRIPFIVYPVAVQLQLATIPVQFKDVLVAVAVCFVWPTIPTLTVDANIEQPTVFYL